MDRLLAMESFVRTVERGSFAAAAAGRGLSPSMVGNHIRFLEARLGASLLNRTTRQQSLTEFGRAYFDRCRQILNDVDEADRTADLLRDEPRGLLRVTAPLSLGTTVLPGIVAAYLRRYADVQVELVLQDRRLYLLGDELDVALRAGPLPDSGLIARSLPPMRLIAAASPAYLAARGWPQAPVDLLEHNCLDFTYAGEPRLWRFTGPEGETAVPIRGTLRVDNGQALRAACLEDLGIVLQPELLLHDDIASGRLRHVLPGHDGPSLPVHLLTVPDRHRPPKLRCFVELVVERLRPAAPAFYIAPHTPEA